MSRVIITAALNGPTTHRGACPGVPLTPAEIAAEAQRAYEAGAAVVHVHAREDGGAPSYRAERWRGVVNAVRERCPALVSVSTGLLGVTLQDRMCVLDSGADLASIPVGTLTYARYNSAKRAFDFDHVFANPFADVLALLGRARERGVAPLVVCSDLGHISAVEPLQDMGALRPAVAHSLLMGVSGGIQPTTHNRGTSRRSTPASGARRSGPPQDAAVNLCRMVEAVGRGSAWQIECISPSPTLPWRMLAGAVSIGGHLRVGFQDTVHLPDGDVAESNGTLVTAAATLVRAVGFEPASVEEARGLLLV